MKKFKLFLSICLLLMFLCSCGTAKEVSEKQMVTDLSSCDTFYTFREINPMEIKGLEVEKRQTSAEDEVDTIWVKVDAQNDNASGIMHYIMTYGLYNDGWHLDEVEENRTETWSFTPTAGPSEELIAQWLPESAEIIDDTLRLEDGQENITYSYTGSNRYCKTVREECMTFTFDSTNMGLWDMSNTVTNSEETTWDVCGRYALYENGSKTDRTVTIDEFSTDRVVWKFDDEPGHHKMYLTDVSSSSVNDYYLSLIHAIDRVLYRDYIFTIDNVDWSEMRYVCGGLYIDENHIYTYDREKERNDVKREITHTLKYELIPIAE